MTNVFHPPIFTLLVSEESGKGRMENYTKKTRLKFVIQRGVKTSNVVHVREITGKWENRKTTTGSLNNHDFQKTICKTKELQQEDERR